MVCQMCPSTGYYLLAVSSVFLPPRLAVGKRPLSSTCGVYLFFSPEKKPLFLGGVTPPSPPRLRRAVESAQLNHADFFLSFVLEQPRLRSHLGCRLLHLLRFVFSCLLCAICAQRRRRVQKCLALINQEKSQFLNIFVIWKLLCKTFFLVFVTIRNLQCQPIINQSF